MNRRKNAILSCSIMLQELMLQALNKRTRECIKPMPDHIKGPYLITMSTQQGQSYPDI